MGRILTDKIELITTLQEKVGLKSGVALSREQIDKVLEFSEYISKGKDKTIYLIRSEVYEDLFLKLLVYVGNIPSHNVTNPILFLNEKYRRNLKDSNILSDLWSDFLTCVNSSLKTINKGAPVNITPFYELSYKRFGADGIQLAHEIVEAFELARQANLWNDYSRLVWKDTIDLEDLFHSEKLSGAYGSFFDQRFIDYLNANFDNIASINWRQFEGLVCEFFDRQGFFVQIGKGRNDENIDARIWPTKEEADKPPLCLVQCKREKEKVGKVIVKALYADIVNEKAESGLIVTSSDILPGAKRVCKARGYPIQSANRAMLRKWIEAMRSPFTGVFMGE